MRKPPGVLTALVMTVLLVAPTSVLADHTEPTAPIQSGSNALELYLFDADTGTPVDCSTIEEVSFPRLRFEAFVNVTSVPSEHWVTRLHVLRGHSGTNPQWSLNPYPHQNAGIHGEDETRMKILEGHNNELAIFPPQTWTIKLKVKGDVSNIVHEKLCTFETVAPNPVAAGLRSFWVAASRPAEKDAIPAVFVDHTESTTPLVSPYLRINAGDYPGLNQNPAECDGTDVFTKNVRIEPKVRVDGIPTEHWDATMEFFRDLDGDDVADDLAWNATWFHQNDGKHNGNDKGWRDFVQGNNYDFLQFPDVETYNIRVTVEGPVSGQHVENCPFTFTPAP